MQDFINAPIHADADPLVTLRIFRQNSGDTLCIKVNHSICDAGGLKEYVSILSNVYNMLLSGEECVVEPNLGRRDQTQIFQNRDPKSLAMKGFPTPTWTLPQKAGTQPLHAFCTVNKTQFAALKQYARDNLATVND